ncbi:serine/threonine-protein phosphatase [Sphaerisporangium album]|uniref:Serine/threonine-protein phosphatase n=1 Tax=Sphaerisporangium album TaxID=509200 RepID=A0A367FQ97_9ACTN|nr:PP2C family protein-serine/threonine phosphatase [Sphaerisporangium album]RCG32451.1 serine/threonine-protein phosphatase [Sphaerisporangium album]
MAIPLALIVVIAIADIITPATIQLSPLLVAAPAVTASFAGPKPTALIGAVAVAVQVLLDVRAESLGFGGAQTQLAALALVSAFLVLFATVIDRHREELVRVRSVSEAAQRALLRPLPARLGSLRVASMYLAAQREAQIGGDLYAAARSGTGSRLLIGDVRGKGLPSVSDAALLLGAFREAARRQATLPEIVQYLDESVRTDLEEHAEESGEISENFITAAILEIPEDKPVVHLIDCGHPPPLLIRDGQIATLQVAAPAPPLGLGELGDRAYLAETFDFKPGDTLLLYTDGVVEARCPSGGFYQLADRLASWPCGGPETLVAHVRDDLLAYVGGRLGDDAAMVAIQRLPV